MIEGQYDHMLNFSPDSPLFAKRVQDFENDFSRLDEFLRNLCKLMHQYCKDTRQAAKSCEAFHVHMRNGLGSSTSHSKLSKMLVQLSDVFGEIASSQEILADSLTQSLVVPLEAFRANELSNVHKLQQKYRKDRSILDDTIIRYLQSDVGVSSANRTVQHKHALEIKAYDVVQQRRKFELERFDMIRNINEIEYRKHFEVAEACVASLIALRTHHHFCSERLYSCDRYIRELNKTQQEERSKLQNSKNSINSQRNNLEDILNSMVERVEIHLSPTVMASYHDSDTLNTDPLNMTHMSTGEDVSRVTAVASSALSRIGAYGANFIGFGSRSGNTTANLSTSSHSRNQPSGASGHNQEPLDANQTGANIGASVEEVEMRLKALDQAELESLYILSKYEEYSGGVIKQGHLLEKSITSKLMASPWSRGWLVIDDTKVYFLRLKEAANTPPVIEPQVVCDTMLATVRELRNPELPFTFEIVYANVRTFTLQTEGPKEYIAWVDAVRGAIEKRLISGNTTPISAIGATIPNSTSNPSIAASASQAVSRRKEMASVIEEIMRKSPRCMECNKRDPDWVSLNLGVLVCIECSGVHRSLGVHISKVRSLSLDDLEPEEYSYLLRLGNDLCAKIWAKNITREYQTLKLDSFAARDKFIRAKYQYRLFLDPVFASYDFPAASDMDTDTEGSKTSQKLSAELLMLTNAMKACQQDDIAELQKAIALGLEINEKIIESKDGAERSMTLLHITAEHGSLGCTVLLVMNGADLYAKAFYPNLVHDLKDDSSPNEDNEALKSDVIDFSESEVTTEAVSAKDDEHNFSAEEVAIAFNQMAVASYLNRKAEVIKSGTTVRSPTPTLPTTVRCSTPTEIVFDLNNDISSEKTPSKGKSRKRTMPI